MLTKCKLRTILDQAPRAVCVCAPRVRVDSRHNRTRNTRGSGCWKDSGWCRLRGLRRFLLLIGREKWNQMTQWFRVRESLEEVTVGHSEWRRVTTSRLHAVHGKNGASPSIKMDITRLLPTIILLETLSVCSLKWRLIGEGSVE